jgi:hypothetical protein
MGGVLAAEAAALAAQDPQLGERTWWMGRTAGSGLHTVRSAAALALPLVPLCPTAGQP